LKLRYWKGLKARHIDSRWRKPPEPCEEQYLRPEGPTQQPVCRPFRPQFVDDIDPVARATGIGCIGPPGLMCATSKSVSDGRTIPQNPSLTVFLLWSFNSQPQSYSLFQMSVRLRLTVKQMLAVANSIMNY